MCIACALFIHATSILAAGEWHKVRKYCSTLSTHLNSYLLLVLSSTHSTFVLGTFKNFPGADPNQFGNLGTRMWTSSWVCGINKLKNIRISYDRAELWKIFNF